MHTFGCLSCQNMELCESCQDPSNHNCHKVIVYTVSGAGTADANGDYYDSEETNADGHRIYTNDKCTLCLSEGSSDSNGYTWEIRRSNEKLYTTYTIGVPTMSEHFWGTVAGEDPVPTVVKSSSTDSSAN